MGISFRHSAGFGKRMEYNIVGKMLMEGLDCYMPLVDDHGVDCVVKKKDGTIVEIEDSFVISNSWWTQCLVAGTLVTLANGTKKKIEDLTYEDNLLVWDFDNACMASAKPLWLQKEQKAERYNLLKFSDGNILKTINQHRILNIEKGKFTYPMTDETPIGTTTLNDKGEKVKLVSKEIIEEKVTYYNLITNIVTMNKRLLLKYYKHNLLHNYNNKFLFSLNIID